ncbi:transposase [Streptomyces sp. PanSC19]|uniref:transposase n=1 Tax=Streptomyces sp. PanSC19 TaxID=1520455 RepID=UPI00160B70E8
MPLTDAQWARSEPLLPGRTPRRGGRWRDHREAIDAIAWKFQTGSQWVHLPEKYGNWRGVCNRLRMWPSTARGSGCSPRSSHRPTPRKTSVGCLGRLHCRARSPACGRDRKKGPGRRAR